MNQDFLDLLRAFTDRNVRFLIVGAYALAVHGRPRATGDLDVWVDADARNAAKVMLRSSNLARHSASQRRRLQSARHRVSDGPAACPDRRVDRVLGVDVR